MSTPARYFLSTAATLVLLCGCQSPQKSESTPSGSTATQGLTGGNSATLIKNMRQLTFSGLRSGEGYFSPDGELMVFQSERETDNPFYQMYTMNLKTQKVTRISPGYGKTTCGWIFPDKKEVLYSSTHSDPKSKDLQRVEFEARKNGPQKRYAWDYDPNYEIYTDRIQGGRPKNISSSYGYDAEASASPDGQWIVFTSNRHAYASPLSESEKAQLEQDPSYFLDLYVMDKNGQQVRRLTNRPGYDGGPFFSPDGSQIVFRRFKPDGKTAEIFTLDTKSGVEQQITRLGVMSWAPFFHPSGDYLVFTSNLYGYQNFELFIVDTAGRSTPVRVTTLEGFDGLPVFTPDGEHLTWNRKGPDGATQIVIADWNDSAARTVLGLSKRFPEIRQLKSSIEAEDAQRFVSYLASTEMQGRATGSSQETVYTAKIADYFRNLGLSPVAGSYFQDFPFSLGARLGSENSLILIDQKQRNMQLGVDWTPLSFSKSAALASSDVVFVGYGLSAPAEGSNPAYDSYAGLDVTDKLVLMFRYSPDSLPPERSQYLRRFSRLEHKVMTARQKGARGVIVINGPESRAKAKLVPFKQTSSTDAGIIVFSVNDDLASDWFKQNGKNLASTQKDLDRGKTLDGFQLSDFRLSANVSLIRENGQARNVVALLKAPGAVKTVVIGAHGDHLGVDAGEAGIHFGADDNASGVAGVLELAHYYRNKAQNQQPRHNILFAVWSGEELGNLGSAYFTQNLKSMGLAISAYLNLDMVGRLTNEGQLRSLYVQGAGSSPDWRNLLERIGSTTPMVLSDDPYLPTDSTSFYTAGVPVLSFFTGIHSDYHTPRDTSEKVDYVGLKQTAQLVAQIGERLAWTPFTPKYTKIESQRIENRRGFRIFLGTIPDYSTTTTPGVRLSGVIKGGPAEQAGLKAGDVIVKLSSFDIQTINDYVYSLESVKPGLETNLTVLRDGSRVELKITPTARE
jgi:Tol biopolymer transport system component